jgi:hypothetical protein
MSASTSRHHAQRHLLVQPEAHSRVDVARMHVVAHDVQEGNLPRSICRRTILAMRRRASPRPSKSGCAQTPLTSRSAPASIRSPAMATSLPLSKIPK